MKKRAPEKKVKAKMVARKGGPDETKPSPTLRQIADVMDALGVGLEIQLKPKKAPWWRRLWNKRKTGR